MYGFLRIARSVAIVGLDRREFIRPPSSLPQPCFCFSIPFHLFVYVHLVTLPVLSSRLEYDPGRGCSPFGRSESSGPQPHVLPPKRIQLFYLTQDLRVVGSGSSSAAAGWQPGSARQGRYPLLSE